MSKTYILEKQKNTYPNHHSKEERRKLISYDHEQEAVTHGKMF